MAHFYGLLKGGSKEVTRTGTKTSGMVTSINGWDVGGTVTLDYDADNDSNVIEFRLTGGSNNKSSYQVIAKFEEKDGKINLITTEIPEAIT